ncbi:hypothetical protein CYMTET_5567 [Cymbomonas tetramitiformis]|uniref:Uncharacterized protein n=1 Tax=Cymbomonas tetramitiformis TaxID=36881 RepID=A0AAE0GZC4_9CHLO|nr:hypothetical protein CYMTET_37154 [Cymbomonas tetramitiformis]KAK3286901.1 hypothetical protein CYMTET_5567 [Cymbomonas tetramitiformis]
MDASTSLHSTALPAESYGFDLIFEEPAVRSRAISAPEDGCRRALNSEVRLLCGLLKSRDTEQTLVRSVVDQALTGETCAEFKGTCGNIAIVQSALSTAGYKVIKCSFSGVVNDGKLSSRHSFIEVQLGSGNIAKSLIVDPNLREVFQICRPSQTYNKLLQILPTAFVGTRRQLSQVTEFMCHQMAESFAEQGLTTPPWRQASNMILKWQQPVKKTEVVETKQRFPPEHVIGRKSIGVPAIKQSIPHNITQPQLKQHSTPFIGCVNHGCLPVANQMKVPRQGDSGANGITSQVLRRTSWPGSSHTTRAPPRWIQQWWCSIPVTSSMAMLAELKGDILTLITQFTNINDLRRSVPPV